MTKQSDKVKSWRKRWKERIVAAMGGGCQTCGYDKCHAALELHHIDMTVKDFTFSHIRASPVAVLRLVGELNRCALLCTNCHREIHAGLRPNLERGYFDESLYRSLNNIEPDAAVV